MYKLDGFELIQEGRIHMRCYVCGRKQSNMIKALYDPPKAHLMEHPCPKCSDGAMEPAIYYYDENGEEIKLTWN